jgi:CheY-like chemotaxis protein
LGKELMQKIKLKVLFVDDCDADVELALRLLKQRGFEIAWDRVEMEGDMRRLLTESPPQLILSDFSMPCFEGALALRVARELAPQVPFVFLSGSIGEKRAAEAMQLGAAGYVEKGNIDQLDGILRRVAAL